MAEITIIELGRSPRVIDVPAGTTVEDALRSHDINTVGLTTMVDDVRVQMDAALMGGETVTLSSKAAGGC